MIRLARIISRGIKQVTFSRCYFSIVQVTEERDRFSDGQLSNNCEQINRIFTQYAKYIYHHMLLVKKDMDV